MIKSMTGFTSITNEGEVAAIEATIRTVNHRFLDLHLRIPQSITEFEARIRTIIQKFIARGRVEITISLQQQRPTVPVVELREDVINALAKALDKARDDGLITGTLTPGDLLRFPQALSIREQDDLLDPSNKDKLADSIENVLVQACQDLDEMRVREGNQLRSDLEAHKLRLGELIKEVSLTADSGSDDLKKRLNDRIVELSSVLTIDESVLAQEVVRFSHRSDISEELARLRAHLDHWDVLADSEGPCGRKLDFLLQEMNREVNTIGAKADGLRISELVISVKAELERLREQIQNVE